jgi:ribosome-associated translation inhibitor RaiA
MSGTISSATHLVRVDVVGPLGAEEREYAIEKIGSLERSAPVRAARVTVAVFGDPFAPQWVEVRATLSGDRLLVHADAAGATVHEALDGVRQKLYQALSHRARGPRHAKPRWRGGRVGAPVPAENVEVSPGTH